MLSGNTSTHTLHLDNRLTGRWGDWLLDVRGGGLRSTVASERFAVGASDRFTVVEPADRRLDAERYFARGDVKRSLTGLMYWVAGAAWDRDKGAGIEHRTSGHAGHHTVMRDARPGNHRKAMRRESRDIWSGAESWSRT